MLFHSTYNHCITSKDENTSDREGTASLCVSFAPRRSVRSNLTAYQGCSLKPIFVQIISRSSWLTWGLNRDPNYLCFCRCGTGPFPIMGTSVSIILGLAWMRGPAMVIDRGSWSASKSKPKVFWQMKYVNNWWRIEARRRNPDRFKCFQMGLHL